MGKKTYASRFEDEKGKKKKLQKKGSENDSAFVKRMVSSFSDKQIYRMLEDNRTMLSAKTTDPTARAIFNKIQPKLEISQPMDEAELQADNVAEGVMKGDTSFSKNALANKTHSDINAKSDGAAMQTSDAFENQLQSTKGQGQKLDKNTRSELEQHTGTDLGSVNIHTSSEAHHLSDSINAKAFAHGQDIYFKEGQYNQSGSEGKKLLAHEVAHTVQQSENTVQPKIRRQPTETTKVQDTGERPHAEGVFHGDNTEGGYIITPAKFPLTKQYYDAPANAKEKARMDAINSKSQHLYNTFYSLAERFNITVEALQEANPEVKPENIPAGKKIIIPYVPMAVTEPIEKFEPLPARQITFEPAKAPELKLQKRYKTFDAQTVQDAALEIIESDGRVKNALLFFSQIKSKIQDKKEQDLELYKFLTGERKPTLLIFNIPYQGNTPPDTNPDNKSKIIELNENLSFPMAVYTYLHELNHYIGMWYASETAYNENTYREDIETTGGIDPVTTVDDPANNQYRDLDKSEQGTALSEGATATVNMIMEQVTQDSEPDYPHPRTDIYRPAYQDWLKKQKQNPNWTGTSPEDLQKIKKEQDRIRLKLVRKARKTYASWGVSVEDTNLEASKSVELGYVFEKQAYGFYDPNLKNEDWAKNAFTKFEKKYENVIEWYTFQ